MFAVQSHERITRKKTGSASDHQEEDGFREEEDVERAVAESLPKNLIAAHHARFAGRRGFRRHMLSCFSVRAEVRNGEARGLLRCDLSRKRSGRSKVWTEMWSLSEAKRKV